MTRTRDNRRRASAVAMALGIGLAPIGAVIDTIAGEPFVARAQDEGNLSTDTSIGQSGQTGSGQTRGIARPGSVTTQTPATVAQPLTTAATPTTEAVTAVVSTIPVTSESAPESAPVTTPTEDVVDGSTNPAWTVETPSPTDAAGDGPLVDDVTTNEGGATSSLFIPGPPASDGATLGSAGDAVSAPPDEPDPAPVASDGAGWFSGAAVTDGALVPTAETTSPPTTAPVAPSTTAAPAATTPTTAAPTATTPTTNVDVSTRDVGRSRTSGLFEVGAVIAGVIGLSAVPVFLARLVRARREDEPIREQLPA